MGTQKKQRKKRIAPSSGKRRKKRATRPSGKEESHVSAAVQEEGSPDRAESEATTLTPDVISADEQLALPPTGEEETKGSVIFEDETSSDLEAPPPLDVDEETAVTAILEEQAPSDLEKISSLGVEEETEAPVAVEDETPFDSEEAPPLGVDEETAVTAILEEQAPSDLEKISSLGVEEETEAPVAVEDEGPPDLRETPPLGVEDETKVHFTVEDEESQTGPDRRQYARFTVGGRTKGRVTASSDALVLDISLGGAKIEHAQVVRPGTLSFLDLELQGKKVRLRCRVIRSVVHRAEVQPDGERELVYHTGLQFIDPSDELRQLIGDYIQSVIKDS